MNLINKLAIGAMPVIPRPIVGRIASRYVAGERLEDAFNIVRVLNSEGAMATIDLLGEHTESAALAEKAASVYDRILDGIDREKLNANVSLKPTHLGLKIGYELCFRLIEKIVTHAARLGNFVRLDMEDSGCTEDTLRLFRELRKQHDNVGLAIQAYLRRTVDDIRDLMQTKANIRVCKGIYNEHRKIAYKDRKIIINNFALLLELLLSDGCYIGIATHCEETVWHAERIIRRLGLNREQYEFQMLLGVDPELRSILIDNGHRLRVYVPFGEEWFPYSTRRLRENPSIAGYVMRDFLGLNRRDDSR